MVLSPIQLSVMMCNHMSRNPWISMDWYWHVTWMMDWDWHGHGHRSNWLIAIWILGMIIVEYPMDILARMIVLCNMLYRQQRQRRRLPPWWRGWRIVGMKIHRIHRRSPWIGRLSRLSRQRTTQGKKVWLRDVSWWSSLPSATYGWRRHFKFTLHPIMLTLVLTVTLRSVWWRSEE
jgi:hypothetical protein